MDCFVASLLAMTEEEGKMIDHVSVGVADLERAARFYEATLAALGLSRLVTRPGTIGFGKAYPEFWINLRKDMARCRRERHAYLPAREDDGRGRCLSRSGVKQRRHLRRRAGIAAA